MSLHHGTINSSFFINLTRSKIITQYGFMLNMSNYVNMLHCYTSPIVCPQYYQLHDIIKIYSIMFCQNQFDQHWTVKFHHSLLFQKFYWEEFWTYVWSRILTFISTETDISLIFYSFYISTWGWNYIKLTKQENFK